MTVLTTANKTVALGNGATTIFNYSFVIPTATDAVVIYTDAFGNQTTLSPSQFGITGLGNASGGTVTYPLTGTPIASGTTLTIMRVVPVTQTVAISNQGNFDADVIEGALDAVVMIEQQLSETIGRTLVAPPSDPNPIGALPAAAARANQLASYDASGNPTTAGPSSGVTGAATYAAQAAASASAAAASAAQASAAASSVGNFAPTADGPPDMKITVGAGVVYKDTVVTTVAAQQTGTITAPASGKTRIDRVVLDRATGAISVIAGTEVSSNPTPPAVPTGKNPCAQIGPLLSSTTSIPQNLITPETANGSLGLGMASFEALGGSVVDDGAGNLGTRVTVQNKTTTYAMAATDRDKLTTLSGESANTTFTVPAPIAGWRTRFLNLGSHTLTIAQHASETFSGSGLSAAASFNIAAGSYAEIVSDGTNWDVMTPAAASVPTLGSDQTIISTAGSGTITIPANATAAEVDIFGAGAGGGGANGTGSPSVPVAGGAGGAGARTEKLLTGLTPGNTLSYTVGAGGPGGSTAPTNGTDGGDTTLSSGTQAITTLTAKGGKKGTAGTNNGGTPAPGTPGVGGATTGSNGDLSTTGQPAATTAGGSSPYGVGGGPGAAATDHAAGGGAGADNSSNPQAGGAGAPGLIRIKWRLS